MKDNKIQFTMTRKSEHIGSVRFDAPKPEPGKPIPPLQNAYISRSFLPVNDQSIKQITITIEVP